MPAGPPEELILELRDFLPKIPAQLLNPDVKPDPGMLLKFDVVQLADRISKGQTTLPMLEIYGGCLRSFATKSSRRIPWTSGFPGKK